MPRDEAKAHYRYVRAAYLRRDSLFCLLAVLMAAALLLPAVSADDADGGSGFFDGAIVAGASVSGSVEWAQYQNGPGHLGYYNGTGPQTNHTLNFADPLDGIGSVMAPVVDSDTVYIVTDSWVSNVPPKLVALDKKTLAVKWKHDFEDDTTVTYAPVLYKGLVIVTTSKWHTLGSPTDTLEGRIFAFDRSTGALKWKYTEPLNTINGLTLDGDRLYFAAYSYYYRDDGHYAYAMDAATGKVAWRADLPSGAGSIPASSGDYVVFSMRDGTVAAFKKDGAKKTGILQRYPSPQKAWQVSVEQYMTSGLVIYGNHVLFTCIVGSTYGPNVDTTLFCLNLANGAVEWKKDGKCGSTTWATGAICGGNFIIPMSGGVLRTYNVTSGELVRSFNASSSMPGKPAIDFSSTPVVTAGAIYIGGSVAGNFTLFCFDHGGKLIWFNRTKSNVFYAGAFSEGVLYSTGFTGPLVVFDGAPVQGGSQGSGGAGPWVKTGALPTAVQYIAAAAVLLLACAAFYFVLKRHLRKKIGRA